MDTGDAMNTMVPLTFNLGTQEAYDFYKELYAELKEKIAQKKGVAENEKYRLVWGAGLPSWFALGDFQYFNDKGAVFPVEVTYRNAEKIERLDLPKTSDPLEHIAWRWVRLWTRWYDKARKRPGSLPKVERIIEYMEDYRVRRRGISFRLLLPQLARGDRPAGAGAEEGVRRRSDPDHGRGHRRHQLLQRGGYAQQNRRLHRDPRGEERKMKRQIRTSVATVPEALKRSRQAPMTL